MSMSLNKLNITRRHLASSPIPVNVGPNVLLQIVSPTGRNPEWSASTVFFKAKGSEGDQACPLPPSLPPSPLSAFLLCFFSASSPLYPSLLFCFTLPFHLPVLLALLTLLAFSFFLFPFKYVPFKDLHPLGHMCPFLFSCQMWWKDEKNLGEERGKNQFSLHHWECQRGGASRDEQGLGKVTRRMVPSIHLAKYHSLPSHPNLRTARIVSTKQTEKGKVIYFFYCRDEFAAGISIFSFEIRLIGLCSQPPEVVNIFSWVCGNRSLARGS